MVLLIRLSGENSRQQHFVFESQEGAGLGRSKQSRANEEGPIVLLRTSFNDPKTSHKAPHKILKGIEHFYFHTVIKA